MSLRRKIRPSTTKLTRADVLLGAERAGHLHEDLLVRGLHHARRRDRVLRLQRVDQRLPVELQAGQLSRRELDVDLLVLGAEDVDLGDILDAQQL